MYVDYGYYIIRPCRCPEFLKDFSEWILTASGCICDAEPQPFSCMTSDERQKEKYRKRLGRTGWIQTAGSCSNRTQKTYTGVIFIIGGVWIRDTA